MICEITIGKDDDRSIYCQGEHAYYADDRRIRWMHRRRKKGDSKEAAT